ncbi:metallophosphoesterase [Mesorhizobium sp. M0276]|uniref:metallophosphoesterase family protein n=1 Tax=Mesorhizobium sp. M0276 TaxID=2956928 RepID=UPI00333A3708
MKTISPRERPLLRFVVITDTHVNGEGSSPYPYPSGVLANARAAAAFAKVRTLKPDFVLHLGDMVHPLPGQVSFASAAANFRKMVGDLEVPIRWVPGNHDIGDKPSAWLVAPPVSKETRTFYTDALGPDRHCFEHHGIRFVMADATLINSGMDAEEEQWNWLDTNIPRDRRSFLFMHYPPYLTDTDEPEHYDNIANPGRSRLLAMLRDRPVEALFTGHVHNIFMNRFGNTDIHVLPAISFVRNDYSQLFPVPPIDEENGRNHVSRLGFMLVEVFEKGHTVHWVNTNGGTDPEIADQQMTVSMLHPRRRTAPVGVDLRQEWARALPIVPDGVVDELSRKYVRNDHLAMRLQSLGLRHLRVPMQDVIDERAAARMSDFAAFGHTFTVYGIGVPTTEVGDRLAAVAPILSGVEVILPSEAFAETSPLLAAFSHSIGAPVMLSKLRASAHSEGKGDGLSLYSHLPRHGFPVEEVDEAFAAIPAGIAGLCFTVEPTAPLWATLETIAAAAHKNGKRALAHLRLAGASFAKDAGTPEENARRIAEATLAGWAHRAVLDVVIDTFVDFDRGYVLRSGLLNSLCDVRPAGAVLQRLAELLADTPEGGSVRAEGSLRYFSVAGKNYALALDKLPTMNGSATAIRLDTGAMIATDVEAAGMPILLSWCRAAD